MFCFDIFQLRMFIFFFKENVSQIGIAFTQPRPKGTVYSFSLYAKSGQFAVSNF